MNIRGLNWEQTWTNNFIPKPEQTRPFFMETLYKKPKGISLKKANELLVTFAMVRHPFNRLVSGYNNKIRNMVWNSPKTQNDIGQVIYQILQQSRKLSFEQMKTIKDYAKPKEFVEYLLNKVTKQNSVKNLNTHWRPQYASCPFCEIRFDYVGDIKDNDHHVDFLSKLLNFKVRELKMIFYKLTTYITYSL
jgi:hypothetical protein